MSKSDELKILKGTGWDILPYWQSGEYQVITERLDDYDDQKKAHGNSSYAHGVQYNPVRGDLYRALAAVPVERVQVCIVGQDPYPQRMYCTGVAFSVPPGVDRLPGSLINIFKELEDDLHYPAPKNGDLTQWCERGVLLWNVYPTCAVGKPGSHHWVEWELLTEEIVKLLDSRKIVFVFLGAKARTYDRFVQESKSICTSHPSPLGVNHGFKGSRIFSKTNDLLCSLGREAINWRLIDETLPRKDQRLDKMQVQ